MAAHAAAQSCIGVAIALFFAIICANRTAIACQGACDVQLEDACVLFLDGMNNNYRVTQYAAKVITENRRHIKDRGAGQMLNNPSIEEISSYCLYVLGRG